MKIYGDYSFLLDRLNVRNQAQVRQVQNGTKIAEFADKFIEQQRVISRDEMTISQEGMDGLYTTYILLHSDTIGEDGVSGNLYLGLNNRYLKEMNGKDEGDWSAHMESMMKAYADVRQSITEGYENGTREVWVQDDSTGEDFNGIELEIDGQAVRYRKLTKEEEIAYLDKSMDKFIENVAMRYAKEEEAKRADEAQKEPGKMQDDGLDALQIFVDRLVNEARTLLDRVKEEIDKIEKMFNQEVDIQGRMEMEASIYRAETAERGKQQTQYQNYKKMSQMVSDVKTLLGNIRA